MTAAFVLVFLTLCGIAGAHPLTPPLLEIRATDAIQADVTWKTGALATPDAPLGPVLPSSCRPLTAPVTRQSATDTSVIASWKIRCETALVGQRFGVAGLDAASSQALLRVTFADGRVVQQLLTVAEPTIVLPAPPQPLAVVRRYVGLGIRQMLTAPDHLFFVIGLLLLASGIRSLFWAVAGYTMGYSLTLSLTVLGVATFPPRPIALAIALSVLILAIELARRPPSATLMRRRPWIVGAGFGLLHGVGFAGALQAAAPARAEIPLALGAFNLGVEIAGLACVVSALACWLAYRRSPIALPLWAPQIPVYAMGSLAVFWSLQRAAALF